jgi:FixJ family two-component response regulator
MAGPMVFVVDDDTAVRTSLRRLLAPLRHPGTPPGRVE